MNPAGITTPGLRAVPEEPNDDVDVEDVAALPVARTDREGLPSTYRMRADSHYVDQLTRRPDVSRPRDPDPRVEADRRDVRDRHVALLLAQLAEQIASIESAAVQISGADRSPLARRAGVDVISAEAWRAAWMLRATRLVDGTHVHRARLRQIGPVLADIRERLAPEFRLTGSHLHLIASDWNASAEMDEAAFVTALTGAIFATLGLIGDASGASVRVTVKTASGDLQSVEVAQDDVTVTDPVLKHFFAGTQTDRPGGWVASLGAASARAFATMSGAEPTITGGRRGSTLRLSFERPF